MSDEKDPKAGPGPAAPKSGIKTVVGVPALDPGDLERTREFVPGSRPLGSAWPRPAPKGPGGAGGAPDSHVPAKPSSTVPSRPPNMFAGLPRGPSKPPVPPPVEEISASLLLPDDSAGDLGSDVEELSGSVLVEDAPDGEGLLVSRIVEAQRAAPPVELKEAPSPAEPAHRALLGLPHLPTSTPAPVLERQPHLRGRQAPAEPAPPPAHAAEFELGSDLPATDLPFLNQPWLPPAAEGQEHGEQPMDRGTSPAGHQPPLEGEGYFEPPEGSPQAAFSDDVEATELPRSRLSLALEAAKRTLGNLHAMYVKSPAKRLGGRATWVLPVITLSGILLGVTIVGTLFSVCGGSKAGANGTPTPSARPSSLASAAARAPSAASFAAQSPVRSPRPSPAPALPPCQVIGSPHVVAPAALVGAGVEARAFGDDVALAFAAGEREAVAVRLDVNSLSISATERKASADTIRRVRAVVGSSDGLDLVVDADRKHDALRARRSLPLDPPLQVGISGAELVWTRMGGPAAGRLWRLDGEGDLDALRAASEGAPGDTLIAVAFRRGAAVWMGAATGYKALTPKGGLSHVDGLGASVGSPAVALSDGVAMVTWADRPSAEQAWRLRWVTFKPGDPPGAASTFAPPPGVQGGHVMSPGLAAAPGGRFLLVWTEGPQGHFRVRAMTLAADGSAVGVPLEISGDAGNAGQGQAAVTAAGKGLVAFLQSTDTGFQVVATPISCR